MYNIDMLVCGVSSCLFASVQFNVREILQKTEASVTVKKSRVGAGIHVRL